jgi:hypothetical protein
MFRNIRDRDKPIFSVSALLQEYDRLKEGRNMRRVDPALNTGQEKASKAISERDTTDQI